MITQFTYNQTQQGNNIPDNLSLVPIIPIQDQADSTPPSITYCGSSTNFTNFPREYPVTSYSQSNISAPYTPSQNMIPQQMSIVPNVLNGNITTPIQYQPINPVPLNQKNAFQTYSIPTNNLGTQNAIMFPMEQNKLVQRNLYNPIQIANPTTNQQNIVQYNIFPQAINSFNSGNQSFAPNGMNLSNNVNINNGQILHRENIMNQYGQNKNNININSGLQNLSISNDKNTNEKVCGENKDVGLIPVPKEKKVQFECPICHEEYNRQQFFSGRKKREELTSESVNCKTCHWYIRYDDFCFKCDFCQSFFCDDCAIEK